MNRRLVSLLAVCCMLLSLCVLPSSASADGDGPAVRPGDHFRFGFFEQDFFTVNGPEPIVWRVLDTDDASGLVLAVSEFGLYTMKYHRNDRLTAWGDTDVRSWLNTVFLSSFTREERSQVSVTPVSGSMDSFFLLDAGQVRRYLSPPYLCYATPWALVYGEHGAYVNADTGASSWLVRTDYAEKRIAWVGGGGALYTPDGRRGVNYLTSDDNTVRPAMWVRAEACRDLVYSYGFPAYAFTNQRISTRSGPSTGYCGLGDYFDEGGHLVKVLSRFHDGNIWWLEIEFEYNDAVVRCYTGLKRIDVNIARIPEDPAGNLGYASVRYAVPAYYGPGNWYKKMKDSLTPPAGTFGFIVKQENGWSCLEYQGETEKIRVWLPSDALEAN